MKDTLLKELEKPSIEQSRTPTQIVNNFLNKEFNESFSLTPADFGEKAHKLIMQWGFQKTKDMNYTALFILQQKSGTNLKWEKTASF